MKVFTGSAEAALSKAAEAVLSLVRTKPDCVLALSASSQLDGVYAALRESGADFSRCTVFLAEEFVNVEDASLTRRAKLEAAFLSGAHISRVHCPDAADCEGYEAEIASAGGIDLALLAIGRNGRIAFDEPLAAFDSATHVTKLTESAQQEECAAFGANPPSQGVTVGIHTLMRCRRALLVALGSERAEAVHKAVAGRTHISVPASLMQLHLNAELFTDEAAAAEL